MLLRSEGENTMQARLELDKVAPDALKAVLQVSAYINNHSGLERTLLNLFTFALPKSTAALGVSICTPKMRVLWEKPSSGCTKSVRGGTRHFIAIASGPPWHGQRR
jgi:hypothetical protein